MAAPPPYSQVGAPQGYQTAQTTVVTTAPIPGYEPGYQAAVLPGYQPTAAQAAPPTYVYVGGNCPVCKRGNLQEGFTPLGICLAIWFFPIGIVCCVMLTEKRCSHCGAVFS